MKKNAFTLIELIAVIAILGFILVIIVPNIVDILGRTKERLNDRQKEQIVAAARQWGTEQLGTTGNVDSSITVKDLQTKGYLDDKVIKNIKDKTNIENTVICITYQNNQYIYTYKGELTCK